MTDSDVSQDHYYMQTALNLSLRGQGNTWPNPSVGTIIVKNKNVISRGWTQPNGRPHAEVVALKKNKKLFKGATLYSTLEPCSHFGKTSPCVDLIIKAKIRRVVIATLDPNPKVNGKGIKKLKQNNIKVTLGILEKKAKKINLGFFQKITAQTEFETWGNLIGIRTDQGLHGFNTSLLLVNEQKYQWPTRKEGQKTDFKRDDETKIFSYEMRNIRWTQTIKSLTTHSVRVQIDFSSPKDTLIQGAYFRINLPQEFNNETRFEITNPES